MIGGGDCTHACLRKDGSHGARFAYELGANRLFIDHGRRRRRRRGSGGVYWRRCGGVVVKVVALCLRGDGRAAVVKLETARGRARHCQTHARTEVQEVQGGEVIGAGREQGEGGQRA